MNADGSALIVWYEDSLAQQMSEATEGVISTVADSLYLSIMEDGRWEDIGFNYYISNDSLNLQTLDDDYRIDRLFMRTELQVDPNLDLPPHAVHLDLESTVITDSTVTIHWTQNENSDFSAYLVYCGNDGYFDTDEGDFLARVSDQGTTSIEIALEDLTGPYLRVFVEDQAGQVSGSNYERLEIVTNSLVGTWVMSNLEQTTTFIFTDDSFAPIYHAGDTAGTVILTWADFQAMGVSATISIMEDGTFTLYGTLPVPNDTLGVAPFVVPLTDAGNWNQDDELETLILDGAFYDLGGLLTWSDDRSTIALSFINSGTSTYQIPINMGGTIVYYAADLEAISTMIMGFTRQ